MTIFNRAARWIESWTFPKWLNDLMLRLTNEVLYKAIKIIGEECWEFIISECIRVSRMSISGTEKAQMVCANTIEIYGDIRKITDSIVNLCIELAVQLLKKDREI